MKVCVGNRKYYKEDDLFREKVYNINGNLIIEYQAVLPKDLQNYKLKNVDNTLELGPYVYDPSTSTFKAKNVLLAKRDYQLKVKMV